MYFVESNFSVAMCTGDHAKWTLVPMLVKVSTLQRLTTPQRTQHYLQTALLQVFLGEKKERYLAANSTF
jgi:hypothetical protein